MLYLYKRINGQKDLCDIPVYLTHTSLVEDPETVGINAYRYIIFKLSDIFTLTLICGPDLEVEEVRKYADSKMVEWSDTNLTDCAVYYEVPDQILSWLYIDKSESVMRSYTRSDLLLRSGKEDESPSLDSNKHKGKLSRFSRDFEERAKQEATSFRKVQQKYKNEDIVKDRKQQVMYFRDLVRLYLKMPWIDNTSDDFKEEDKNESYEVNDTCHDQYVIAKDYVLYVIKDDSHQLIIMYENQLDIEMLSEISKEFDEFLTNLLKRDYIFSALNDS